MNNLLSVIRRFIEQPNTDFAILINGSWGSGKTHFLKKEVSKTVNEISCRLSDKETKPFELVYVSLYGLSSADELQKKLFLEINPVLKTKTGKITASIIGKMLHHVGLDINHKDEKNLLNIFGGITRNKILVFDDLERLSTETLNEVLGFINTYTEHQNLKVIIVADEQKIKNKIPDYDNVKEKLIRFTYLFNPELSEVFPGFISSYSSEVYRHYLSENKKFICDLFSRGEHKNLRSLRFVLDLFESIFAHVNNLKEIEKNNAVGILNKFLLFVTAYSVEYKKNEKDKLLNSLATFKNGLESVFDPGLFNEMKREMAERGEWKEVELTETEKYVEDFEKKYISGSEVPFEYYDFLAGYIHSGDLDLAALKETCITYQQITDNNKSRPELVALLKLENCLTLNDEEFQPLIEEIYTYVDDGKYELEKYPVIFQNFLNAALNDITGVSADRILVDRFKKGMEKSVSHSQYKSNFRSFVSIYQQENDLLKEVREFARGLNDSLLENTNRLLATDVFDFLKAGQVQKFCDIISGEEVSESPIFAYINADVFAEKVFSLHNKEKLAICETFAGLTSRFIHYQKALLKESPFFDEFLKLIMEKIAKDEVEKHLSTIIYKKFKSILENIVAKLRELKSAG